MRQTDWGAHVQQAKNIWLYIRTHDDNFAFHVHDRLLSLACCKGDTIREHAVVEDIVVAMTSVECARPLRVSGIFRVGDAIPRQTYYDRYANGYAGIDARHLLAGRLDNIYNNGHLLMNNYHCPDDFPFGVVNDMKSDNVILSCEFSCFGEGTPTAPGILVPENLNIRRGFRKALKLKEDGVLNSSKHEHAEEFCQFLARSAKSGVSEVKVSERQSEYDWSRWNWKKAAMIVKEARQGRKDTSTCKIAGARKDCCRCS